MEASENNKKVAHGMGNLVEALLGELMCLPLSDTSKLVMVQTMISDVTSVKGNIVSFEIPPGMMMERLEPKSVMGM
jgi:hypothetical protein